MLDKPVVAFDIESIPDPEIGRRAWELQGTDAEVIRGMVEKRRVDTDGRTDYPQSPFHMIVCACVTILHPNTRVEVRSLGTGDERSVIESFYRLVEELAQPTLVTWNGGGFDLPVLRYRAMARGIAAPAFYRHEGNDPRIHGYGARYGSMHFDLMDELSGYGASSQVGLANVSKLLDLPGKSFVEKQVWEHWLDGERERVIEYCKLDTILTTLIFLAWRFHTGHLQRSDVDTFARGIRESIARKPFSGWREIEKKLEGWPRWK